MSQEDAQVLRFIDAVARHLVEFEADKHPYRTYLTLAYNTMEVARAYVEGLSAWQCARNLCAKIPGHDQRH